MSESKRKKLGLYGSKFRHGRWNLAKRVIGAALSARSCYLNGNIHVIAAQAVVVMRMPLG